MFTDAAANAYSVDNETLICASESEEAMREVTGKKLYMTVLSEDENGNQFFDTVRGSLVNSEEGTVFIGDNGVLVEIDEEECVYTTEEEAEENTRSSNIGLLVFNFNRYMSLSMGAINMHLRGNGVPYDKETLGRFIDTVSRNLKNITMQVDKLKKACDKLD